VKAIVIRRKVFVYGGRITLVLLETERQQDTLAILEKRLAVVAQDVID
jgi:hypothetical protein